MTCLYDSQSDGVIVHISPLEAPNFSSLGEPREMSHGMDLLSEVLSTLPKQELYSSPAHSAFQSTVSCTVARMPLP